MRFRHVALVLVIGSLTAAIVAARQADPSLVTDPAQYVDTRIGTANGGNTFPGAVLPFGMLAGVPNKSGPIRRADRTRCARLRPAAISTT